MTSIEWLIEQFKEYDFTPASNNEEYVIIMPCWIFDSKIDEAKEMHKTEQEISDEKILDAAEEHSDSFLNRGVAMSSFARGCYWYREQLKQRQCNKQQ